MKYTAEGWDGMGRDVSRLSFNEGMRRNETVGCAPFLYKEPAMAGPGRQGPAAPREGPGPYPPGWERVEAESGGGPERRAGARGG